MTDNRKASLDLLRAVIVALSSDETNSPAASKERIERAAQTARRRAMLAAELSGVAASAPRKRRPKSSDRPRGVAGGKARSEGHPMRKVEMAFLRFYADECRKHGWNRNSAGKFGRLMAKQHGVSARHAASFARLQARQKKAEVQRAK